MDSKQLGILKLTLRIGAFGVFIGHGILATQGKHDWIPLLTSVGFSSSMAVTLLPIIGVLDIIIAFLILFLPLRIVLIWACFWAFATALSRPIAGLSILAFVERSANWAVPLALLIIQGFPKKMKDLIKI